MSSSRKPSVQYQQLAQSPPPPQYQQLAQSPPPPQSRQTVVLVPVQAYGNHGQTMFMTAGVQQSPFVMMPTRPAPVAVSRPPSQFIVPNSYLVLTVILLVLLTLFAPETFFIMIPALLVSLLSRHASTSGRYGKAKRLGNLALALNIIAILVAMVIAILVISLTFSFHPWYRAYDYYNNYWGGCYYDYDYETGSGDARPMICVNK